MSVRRAQEEIDAREFTEWMAYATLEPFGEGRADLRSGIVAAVIANANRGRGARAFKPADFVPVFAARQRQSADQIRHTLSAFARAHNRSIGKR